MAREKKSGEDCISCPPGPGVAWKSWSGRSLLTFRFTYMILYVMKEFSTQVLRSHDMRAMVKALAIPDCDEENNRKGSTSS